MLGPTLASSGLSTKMECCATEGWDYAQQYAAAIEADPTALADTAVFTSHGYTAAPTSPLSGWSKPAWETEWSTFETWDPAWDDGTDASGLTWAQHIYQGLTGANLNAFLYWWGSTTPSENGDNEGLIQINGSTVTASGRLWAFANYSRYIHPGAVRIAATSSNSGVDISAFKNTDGTVAVVALNTGTSADPITYSLSGTGTPNGATVTPYLTNSVQRRRGAGGDSASAAARSPRRSRPGRWSPTWSGPRARAAGTPSRSPTPATRPAPWGPRPACRCTRATPRTGQTLSYSATGLPAGLSIASGTGLISGTPTTAGTVQRDGHRDRRHRGVRVGDVHLDHLRLWRRWHLPGHLCHAEPVGRRVRGRA